MRALLKEGRRLEGMLFESSYEDSVISALDSQQENFLFPVNGFLRDRVGLGEGWREGIGEENMF